MEVIKEDQCHGGCGRTRLPEEKCGSAVVQVLMWLLKAEDGKTEVRVSLKNGAPRLKSLPSGLVE